MDHIPQRRRMHGFTLIELMIAMVVVAILASIAFPSYQDHVRKTRRADGKAALMESAQQLERCYSRFSRYDDADCGVALPVSSPEGFYAVSAGEPIGAASFTLVATPQNAQAGDVRCGALTLTHTGRQGSQGQDQDSNDCW